MYIKSIVVDGFKSYAKRTEITGFDPAFNAITGLNGSGKSNILDAICFVLGITNLSHVRAANLQELIYKGGQAGVVKAIVSIVFDNRVKAESPLGYENFEEVTVTRQIVVGGTKNKYLINGITAQNSRVHDLFHSVQLNVNNPHFLIMQGRITKVLNMKPAEILSLLEEAAATKLYESKRESTLATIEKKESKMREIEKLLKEEIRPKLEKLRKERSSYMDYQNISRELDYLNKFIIAWKYSHLKVTVDNAEGQLTRLKEQRSKEENAIIKCNETKKTIEHSIAILNEERETNIMPKYETLELQLSELQKTEALLNNAVKRASDSLESLKQNYSNLEKEKTKETLASKKIRQKIDKIQSQYDVLKNKMNENKISLDTAQKRLQEVNSGLFSNESGAVTASLSDILSSATRIESQLETELNVLKMKINHSSNLVNDLEKKIRGLQRDAPAAELEQNHKQLENRLAELSHRLDALNYSPEKYGALSEQLLQKKQEIRNAEYQRNTILNENRWLKFQYNKPHAHFDDNMVHGVVATLIRVTDAMFFTALQTAAGGRLFNIIVENDEVAAQLIGGNCMKERKTLLPLNKINAEPLHQSLIKRAEDIVGKNNVWSVMSLVTFEERYRKAMTYAFGQCFIARNLDVAKKIAFDSRIKCKAVTLEGDVFDPEGTLAGGSDVNQRDIMTPAQNLTILNDSLRLLVNEGSVLENAINSISTVEKQWKEFSQEKDSLEIKKRQLEIRMMQNTYLEFSQKLVESKLELDKLNNELAGKKIIFEQAKKKTVEAKENLANSASVKEKAQRSAENEVNLSKERFEKSENDFAAFELKYEELMVELKSNEDDIDRIEQSLKDVDIELSQKEDELRIEKEGLRTHSENMSSLGREFKEQRKCLMKLDEDINKKRQEMKKLAENKEKAESNLEEVNHNIEMHHVDSAAAEERLAKMLMKNAWIPEECGNFGKVGSMYDFEANNLKTTEQKIEKLSDQKQKLSRKVDMRGMNMLGQMEVRYDEVTSKYNQVKRDKLVLQEVIDDLDKRKDEVLRKAHEQVDNDFNNIFSTLLPGSKAKLTPPQGMTLKEGLEFRISFGNVWKESLTELSGGQRSLVALSLILALLRFKPAPLYILDEVDAALDISHTQNIGTIIKEQFSNSQFIIVSLKDGMFNNANVLFKTKFVDGVSTVSRHTNQSRRPMTEKNS